MSEKPKTPGLPNPERNPPPAPPPRLVTVKLVVTPGAAAAAAEIKVRDRAVQGETVFQIGVDTKVVVTAPGYKTWEKTVQFDKDGTLAIDLQPAPR